MLDDQLGSLHTANMAATAPVAVRKWTLRVLVCIHWDVMTQWQEREASRLKRSIIRQRAMGQISIRRGVDRRSFVVDSDAWPAIPDSRSPPAFSRWVAKLWRMACGVAAAGRPSCTRDFADVLTAWIQRGPPRATRKRVDRLSIDVRVQIFTAARAATPHEAFLRYR
jgi:hypothetical protein